MQELDQRAVHEFKIPSLLLMENAGRAVAEEAAKLLKPMPRRCVCIVCGKGNNGADGMVAARHLANAGVRVYILVAAAPGRFRGDARVQWRIVQAMGLSAERIGLRGNFNALERRLEQCDLVVDALLGTGISGRLKPPYLEIIERVNSSRKPVLAVDVPSGLDATTGKLMGPCVRARRTVTFACPKTGLLKGEGPKHSGKIVVAGISIPAEILP
ncbi:MAG: NAD(P)H-hydrate epimerase [Candidatus Omnitrophica bacterium]|nr:NAD(P)H-hydrate epimerase [Candidatus Omnitrophota bacterium]